MTKSEKKVNKMQLFFIGTAAATIFKVINMPDMIASVSGRDSWLAVLLLLAVDAAVALLIIWAYKINPDLTFKQIMDKTVGKVISCIVMILFGALLIFKLYIMLESAQKFMVDNLYPDTTWQPFTMPVIVLLIYTALKGLQPIARSTQIFGYFFSSIMSVAVVGYLMISDLSNLLPILGEGFLPVARGVGDQIACTGDFLILAVLLGRIKPEKGVAKAMTLSVVFSSIIVLLFNVAFWAFYERMSGFHTHGEALIDMARAFRGSDTFARLDVLIVIGWIFASYLNLIIINYAAAQCFMDAFNLEDTKRNRFFCALPAFVILTIVCVFILGSTPFTYKTVGGHLKLIISLPLEIMIPLALPLLACFARQKRGVKEIKNNEA